MTNSRKPRKFTLLQLVLVALAVVVVMSIIYFFSKEKTGNFEISPTTSLYSTNAINHSDIMTVSISCICTKNNSVGSEWTKYFSINGERVSSGSTINVTLNNSMTIFTEITELDDARDDVGNASTKVTVTQSKCDNGFSISQTITVKENGGRYTGNIAIWEVTYTFKP